MRRLLLTVLALYVLALAPSAAQVISFPQAQYCLRIASDIEEVRQAHYEVAAPARIGQPLTGFDLSHAADRLHGSVQTLCVRIRDSRYLLPWNLVDDAGANLPGLKRNNFVPLADLEWAALSLSALTEQFSLAWRHEDAAMLLDRLEAMEQPLSDLGMETRLREVCGQLFLGET